MSLGTGQIEQAAAQAEAFILSGNRQLVLLSGNKELIANGAATVIVTIGHVPWKLWRVVGCGLVVTGTALANKTEDVEFGMITHDDTLVTEQDAFMRIEMTIGGAKEWTAGDMVYHVYKEVKDLEAGRTTEADYETDDADAEAALGTPKVYIGTKLGQWQTKQANIQCAVIGMLASDVQLMPFVLLEVAGLITGRSR